MMVIKIKLYFDKLITENIEGVKKLLVEKDNGFNIFYTVVNNVQKGIVLNEDYEKFITLNKNALVNLPFLKEKDLRLTVENIDVEISDLDKAINTVLFENENFKNFNEYQKAKMLVVEHLKSNTSNLLKSSSIEHEVDLIEGKIETLTENEQKIVESVILHGVDKTFVGVVDECLNNIKNKLSENKNEDERYKLFELQHILTEKKEQKEKNIEEILEILEINAVVL
jgi:hypothetical protein